MQVELKIDFIVNSYPKPNPPWEFIIWIRYLLEVSGLIAILFIQQCDMDSNIFMRDYTVYKGVATSLGTFAAVSFYLNFTWADGKLFKFTKQNL